MVIQLYEKPCKQCGDCCKKSVCAFGVTFLDWPDPPCPALLKANGKYWCGLIVETARWVFPTIGLNSNQYDKIREDLKNKFRFGVGCTTAGEQMVNFGDLPQELPPEVKKWGEKFEGLARREERK